VLLRSTVMARVSSAPIHHDDGWIDAAREDRPDGVTCTQSPEHRHPPKPSRRCHHACSAANEFVCSPPAMRRWRLPWQGSRNWVPSSRDLLPARARKPETQRPMGFATVPAGAPR
jgi:hypothetical protein